MTIALQDIKNVLSLYNIKANVVNHSFFEKYFDDEESQGKFILRADLSDSKSLVIRFICHEQYPQMSCYNKYIET